ncbi:DUF4145 domain-containing protein [Bacillus haynesii]|uniref:DUF4145 domain-containing protein n=1 Tax=Bacillus haynesii TaxID=1925021 RepID=UPI002281DCF4|nr:DUF4145 domain-containing protein [Bacillus haynesii]MCY8090770.1 DUF4145 domain-containing protein [Bacillus haynesii]MCY8292183.1 DUF4145 domain-containing protein [Bacillus haynesii]MCY8409685.1 DUF4145 domain-containing protein [Bacillus haynesii]MCY8434559.1 DUF4145 domain-containing protein [Bacillus haynesii]MCY8626315.1 DUF4145 domain-containing protein [Bacillus haynesii]
MNRLPGSWRNTDPISSIYYQCGHCDKEIGPTIGYYCELDPQYTNTEITAVITICPNCNFPTTLFKDKQIPYPKEGNNVSDLPQEIETIYNEIRVCMSNNAYTASVLLARKLLMNVAVHLGAEENQSFQHYVKYFDSENYIPKQSKDWVDIIRKVGNEATHEIPDINIDDAQEVLTFTEMLLKLIYEFPARIQNR